MSFLLNVLGTFVAFATIMLTGSLVVMALVRVVQYLGDIRGKTLGEMLSSVNIGYRLTNGDHALPGDAQQSAFVLDVLTYPTLHASSSLKVLGGTNLTPEAMQRNRQTLAKRVEYLPEADLVRIVRALSGDARPSVAAPAVPIIVASPASPVAPLAPASANALAIDLINAKGQEIPARWYAELPKEQRSLAAFINYVHDWYATVEAVGQQQYKLSARRMTAVVSCLLVVFLNMDGIQLATILYKSSRTQDLISAQAQSIVQVAQKAGVGLDGVQTMPAPVRGEPLAGFENFGQLNGLLSEPELELGWQNSWIVKKWCSCGQGGAPCPSLWSQAPDVMRWLVGLAASCFLLSLGAPFWLGQLQSVLNLRNTLAPAPKKKHDSDDTPLTA